MKSINFVRERRKKLNKTQLQDKKWFRYAAGFLGAVVLVGLLTVAGRFFFIAQASTTQKTIDATRAAILANETLEESLVVLIHKVESIGNLLEERKSKERAIDFFSEVFGPEALLEKMNYEVTSVGNLLTIKILSRDVFNFESILETVDSSQVRQRYPNIAVGSLDRSADGSYGLEITVSLGTPPTPPQGNSDFTGQEGEIPVAP